MVYYTTFFSLIVHLKGHVLGMFGTELDGCVLSQALGIEISKDSVPDTKLFIVFCNLNFVLDGGYHDINRLIDNVADVITALKIGNSKCTVNTSNVGSCTVLVDGRKNVGDLVIGYNDASTLWVHSS